MMTLNSARFGVAAALSAVVATGAAAAPVLDGGWTADTLQSVNTISDDSPYEFTLGADAFFRITDIGLTGDSFFVYDGTDMSNLVLATTVGGFDSGFGDQSQADVAWTSGDYATGEVLLTAGTYSLNVAGNVPTGDSASFFARLDSMPEVMSTPVPASLPLLVAGIGALGLSRRIFR